MSGAAPRLGWFGKLPARGDFVGAGLSRAVTACWEHWLQSILPAVLAALEARGDAAWTQVPAWCFALPAGQCGPRVLGGVMVPGWDRVHRRYPLLAALEGAAPDAAALAHAGMACRAAIAEGAAPDKLSRALAGIALTPSDAGARGRWWRPGTAPLAFDALPDAAAAVAMLAPA